MKMEYRRITKKVGLQRIIYLVIMVGLATFILRKGKEPWLILISHWIPFIIIVISTSMAIFVQAKAFQCCLVILKAPRISFFRIARVWSIGALIGLLAPFITGLAVRVLLLKREGIELTVGAMATLYQAIINIEYSLFLLSAILIVQPSYELSWLGWIILVGWLVWWLIKIYLLKYFDRFNFKINLLKKLVILQPPPVFALPWLWGQIVCLTINYWLAFNFFGVFLTWPECGVLAATSILVSVAFFMPNGLGLLDTLWVLVAKHHGIDMNEAISLVLVLRLGHLIAAFINWFTVNFISKIR